MDYFSEFIEYLKNENKSVNTIIGYMGQKEHLCHVLKSN